MRSDRVVVFTPLLDDDLGFLEAVEDFAVEQLIAQLRVVALAIAVIPRAARLDERGLCADGRDPLPHGLGDELRAVARREGRNLSRRGAIVGTNMARHTAQAG